VKVTFINTTGKIVKVRLPAGADYLDIFRYELVETNIRASWKAAEFSQQSFGAYWFREILPKGKLELQRKYFRFQHNGEWLPALPPGRYRLFCIYDESKVSDSKTTTAKFFQSNSTEFDVGSAQSGRLG